MPGKTFHSSSGEPKSHFISFVMDEYYVQQSGTGMSAYSGVRYQRGYGFMGRLWKGAFLPVIKKVLPFLGKTALTTGIDIVNDVSNGRPFKESVKRRAKETGEAIEEKTMAKVRQMTGSGRKRRKTRKTSNVRCKKIKRVKRGKTRKGRKSKTPAADFI